MSAATANALNADQPTVAPQGSKVTKLPGIQLDLSLDKDVVVRIPDVNQSYRGKIVGYDPFDYIIASVRLPASVREKLSFGSDIILKYVLRGTVYGFRTTVHNAITSPASLIFFSYPDVIEKIDLRRAKRNKCNIDGMLHTLEGDSECMAVNVSETGCKISARAGTRDMLTHTKVDDTMVVSLNLGSDGMLKIPVAVRNKTLKKGIIYMGCMFLDIRPDEIDLIHKYQNKIQRLIR